MKVMKIIAKPGADTPSRCVPFLPVFPLQKYTDILICKCDDVAINLPM